MKKYVLVIFLLSFISGCSVVTGVKKMVITPLTLMSYKNKTLFTTDGEDISSRDLVLKQKKFTLITIDGETYEFVSKGGYARITGTHIVGTVRDPDSLYANISIPFAQIEKIEMSEPKGGIPSTLGMATGAVLQPNLYPVLLEHGKKTFSTAPSSLEEIWKDITHDLPF